METTHKRRPSTYHKRSLVAAHGGTFGSRSRWGNGTIASWMCRPARPSGCPASQTAPAPCRACVGPRRRRRSRPRRRAAAGCWSARGRRCRRTGRAASSRPSGRGSAAARGCRSRSGSGGPPACGPPTGPASRYDCPQGAASSTPSDRAMGIATPILELQEVQTAPLPPGTPGAA